MKIYKILALSLILMAVLAGLTALSAADESKGTVMGKTLVNGKLTIDEVSFNIPEGYNSVESDTDTTHTDDDGEVDHEDIDGNPVDASMSEEFKNSAGDELDIKVGIKANNAKIEKINLAGAEQKNIAGKDGYLLKEVDDGKEKYKFEYLQDGKLVKIVANSEDTINKVISQ
ncbi:MAG: hypothetical protein IJJ47_10655 [Methanosphaera sp.]|nr:hypothetical protein [Methanosphaera sp.]